MRFTSSVELQHQLSGNSYTNSVRTPTNWVNVWERVTEWMLSEKVSECVREWEWMRERLSECVSSEWVNMWVCERVSECVGEEWNKCAENRTNIRHILVQKKETFLKNQNSSLTFSSCHNGIYETHKLHNPRLFDNSSSHLFPTWQNLRGNFEKTTKSTNFCGNDLTMKVAHEKQCKCKCVCVCASECEWVRVSV
jgi:hypothetical protein